MNELSQGNTMLHQMNEYNSGVKQHNLGIQSEFAQKIVDARTNLKNMGSEDGYAEKLTEKIGGGVGQGAVGLANQMNTAYKGLQSTQEGFNEMGKGMKLARTLGQTMVDAPIGKGVKAAASLGESARNALSPPEAGSTSAQDFSEIPEGDNYPAGSNTAREDLVAGTDNPSAPEPVLSTSTAPASEGADAGSAPVDAKAGAGAADAGEDVDRMGQMIGKAGTMAEGLGALAQGVGVVQGGVDAVKDMISGHLGGDNSNAKAGNELGIIGGALDLAGFAIPGLGMVGAAFGVASSIEGEMGKYKDQEKQIATNLPEEEKSQMTSYGTSGATAESSGQVSSIQSTAQSKIGGGSSAF